MEGWTRASSSVSAGTTTHRRRHRAEIEALPAPSAPRRAVTVYECDECGARMLGTQRCGECGTFMRRVGVGGLCPCWLETTPTSVRETQGGSSCLMVATTADAYKYVLDKAHAWKAPHETLDELDDNMDDLSRRGAKRGRSSTARLFLMTCAARSWPATERCRTNTVPT